MFSKLNAEVKSVSKVTINSNATELSGPIIINPFSTHS